MLINSIKKNNYLLEVLSIVVLALFVRIAFFNGPMGSDDVVYLARSIDVADGHWSGANYNGALRYGYNIPSGFFIYIFGLNEFTANIWPLLCSCIEITAVFLFARKYFGRKAALLAGLFLVFMPLHVAVSTRYHADPVVSMFLTLSFIFFYKAECENSKLYYFITGILLGCVFWTKELVAVTFIAFLIYPIYIRKIKVEWVYLFYGGLVMLLGHFLLMHIINGDPLHAFKVVLGQINSSFLEAGRGEDSPWYYFYYLFIDIKHTWVVPIFSLFIIYFLLSSNLINNDALKYSIFWLMSLLIVLSFFPVSFDPYRFVMKQSNYLTLFLAPLALISGVAISMMSNSIIFILNIIIIFGGLILSALEQQSHQNFTANSRSLIEFSKTSHAKYIYGTKNNSNIYCFSMLINNRECKNSKINELSKMPSINIGKFKENKNMESNDAVYVILDMETISWGNNVSLKPESVPACWVSKGKLKPASYGLGKEILSAIRKGVVMIKHENLSRIILASIDDLYFPKPAYIYAIPANCSYQLSQDLNSLSNISNGSSVSTLHSG